MDSNEGSYLSKCHFATALALLNVGAKIDEPNDEDLTPLLLAVKNGDIEFVKMMVSHGADVNMSCGGNVSLIIACQNSDKEMVKALIDLGACLSPVTLLVALHSVKLLHSCGADLNVTDFNGRNALHWAANIQDSKCVETLLSVGLDVNAKSTTGKTPLHIAAAKDSLPIVRMLLAAGADSEAKDQDGKTPCDLAVRMGHARVENLLRKHSKNIRKRKKVS